MAMMEGTFFQALVIPGHSPDADSLAHYCSSTGVIYCTDRAADMGNGSLLDKVSYRQDFTMKTLNGQISARWTCHGYDCLTLQGAPETGDIPGAMHKPSTIEVKPESLEYAPTGGTKVIDLSGIILMARNYVQRSPIFTTTSTVKTKRASTPGRSVVTSQAAS